MNKKFILIIVALIIVWGTTFYLMINYAEELRSHPCSLCAKKIGEDVSCSVPGATRIFLKNGSIESWDEFEEQKLFLPNLTQNE